MVENLGPHAAHDVNGYKYHCESEFVRSSIQSSHIAISGGNTGIDPSVLAIVDLCMLNDVNELLGFSQETSSVFIRDIEGGLFSIQLIN